MAEDRERNIDLINVRLALEEVEKAMEAQKQSGKPKRKGVHQPSQASATSKSVSVAHAELGDAIWKAQMSPLNQMASSRPSGYGILKGFAIPTRKLYKVLVEITKDEEEPTREDMARLKAAMEGWIGAIDPSHPFLKDVQKVVEGGEEGGEDQEDEKKQGQKKPRML